VEGETRVEIGSEADVVRACHEAGTLAERLGFSPTERAHVVTAISEVAGNIWLYAGRGQVELAAADEPARVGIAVVARDSGPGIRDLELALQDGYSTRGGMGLGLPGARRLMDDFAVDSEVGRGTTVTMARWRAKPGAPAPERPLVELVVPSAGQQERPGQRVVLEPFANGMLIAAVSAGGRGEQAAEAADSAAALLRRHASESPIALAQRCHEELQDSPGAALALASVSELDARMTWLAVGGVDAVLERAAPHSGPAREAAPALRGMVGQRLLMLRATTVPIRRGDTLILSSGGLALVQARFLRGVGERRPPAAR
jgi:anti-sigma regulatory factor (Ser/Thr protein kinase)